MMHLDIDLFLHILKRLLILLYLLFSCNAGLLFAHPFNHAAISQPTHFFRTA